MHANREERKRGRETQRRREEVLCLDTAQRPSTSSLPLGLDSGTVQTERVQLFSAGKNSEGRQKEEDLLPPLLLILTPPQRVAKTLFSHTGVEPWRQE